MNKIIKKYIYLACIVGDMESYLYLGVPIGYERLRDKLSFYTKKVKRIIKPMNQDERIAFGGYGEVPKRFYQFGEYIQEIYGKD